MAQHTSQSKAYRNLTQWDIANLTEDEAWEKFATLRWGSTTSMPCPKCGTHGKHYFIRTRKQWRCKDCDDYFSVTTDTPFADRKLPFKKLLMLVYEFISAPDGCAANRLHSRLGVTLRTAFLNLGKLREALWLARDQSKLKGIVQIDGGHFCGKPRRPNKRSKVTSTIVNNKLRNRKAGMVPNKSVTHSEPWNAEKLKNRRIILCLRELDPRLNSGFGATKTLSVILQGENSASILPVVRKYVDPSAEIWTDCGTGFSRLSAFFSHFTVNHSIEYMTDQGVNNNQAESFFGRMRRGEYGVHYGMRRQYLAFYASEFAWREDQREKNLGDKFNDLMSKVFRCGLSIAWRGYNQGKRLGFEYVG